MCLLHCLYTFVHILMLLQSLNNIIWVAVVSGALFVFHIVYVLADIWNRLYVWVDRKEKYVALVLIKMVDSQCFTPWLTLIDTTSSEHLSHNHHKTRKKKVLLCHTERCFGWVILGLTWKTYEKIIRHSLWCARQCEIKRTS